MAAKWQGHLLIGHALRPRWGTAPVSMSQMRHRLGGVIKRQHRDPSVVVQMLQQPPIGRNMLGLEIGSMV
jgi:hypothetical protein